jgi:hypothetical protein
MQDEKQKLKCSKEEIRSIIVLDELDSRRWTTRTSDQSTRDELDNDAAYVTGTIATTMPNEVSLRQTGSDLEVVHA